MDIIFQEGAAHTPQPNAQVTPQSTLAEETIENQSEAILSDGVVADQDIEEIRKLLTEAQEETIDSKPEIQNSSNNQQNEMDQTMDLSPKSGQGKIQMSSSIDKSSYHKTPQVQDNYRDSTKMQISDQVNQIIQDNQKDSEKSSQADENQDDYMSPCQDSDSDYDETETNAAISFFQKFKSTNDIDSFFALPQSIQAIMSGEKTSPVDIIQELSAVQGGEYSRPSNRYQQQFPKSQFTKPQQSPVVATQNLGKRMRIHSPSQDQFDH